MEGVGEHHRDEKWGLGWMIWDGNTSGANSNLDLGGIERHGVLQNRVAMMIGYVHRFLREHINVDGMLRGFQQ